MFKWIRKIKKENELEYSFIWYKRMEANNKVIYTQPFRTKVKAKNLEEAKEKVTKFALGKMKLVIIPENEYDKTDLSVFQESVKELNDKMSKMFDDIQGKGRMWG